MTHLLKKYSRLLLLLGLSLLTVFALIRLGNIDISWQTLAQVHWGWYSLVFFLFYLSVVARGLRWQRILNTMGWPVNRLYAVTLLTAGLFGSAILPARAGDVGRVAMLKQEYHIPFTTSIASITTERAMDVFAILTMAVIGGLIALQGRLPLEVLQLMGLTAVLFGIGLLGLIAMPTIESWLREINWLRQRLPLPPIGWTIYDKLIDFGFGLIHGVRTLGQHPLTLLIVITESFFIWLYDGFIVYFTLKTIGIELAFAESLFVSMVADLAIAIPLTPGGLGQFEAALIALLTLFDVATPDGSLTALLLRFAIFWSFIPVSGLITYIFGFSRILSWTTTPATSADTTSAVTANR